MIPILLKVDEEPHPFYNMNVSKKWFWFWLVNAFEGIASVVMIFQTASEAESAVLFGLSPLRIGLVLGLLFLIGLCLRFAKNALTEQDASDSVKDNRRYQVVGLVGLLSGYIVVLAWIFLRPPFGITAFSKSLFTRLIPALVWGGLFSVESIFFVWFFSSKEDIKSRLNRNRKTLIWAVTCGILLIFLIVFALKTGLGLHIISGTFYRQGVSILEGHLIFPLLILFPIIGLITFLQSRFLKKKAISEKGQKNFIRLTGLIIWLIASIVWIRTPFEGRSYFLPALRPPNYNFYPSSDAEYYDMFAQSILIGDGFRNGMGVVRPFYAAFLALLHAIAGNNYLSVTNLQIIVLALFPVAVYRIGTLLHFPLSGILAAWWVILREVYSIELTPVVQVSNSRLMMSDLPTALIVSWLMVALIHWYQADEKRQSLFAIISGGLCGIAVQIRTQSAVFIPVVLLFLLIRYSIEKRLNLHTIKSFGIFAVSVLIIILPWNVWNQIHPNPTAGESNSEVNYLYSLYAHAANADQSGEYSDIGISHNVIELILNHPLPILQSSTAHFINNELSSLLILPVRTEPVIDSQQWFHDRSVFWYRENSENVLKQNKLSLFVYIIILSIGFGSAIRRTSWAGAIPFLLHLTYSLGTAFAMTSGFRFILPVDWVTLIYFAIGCVAVMRFPFIYIWEMADQPAFTQIAITDGFPKRSLSICLSFIIILLGLALPLCDSVIPRRFNSSSSSEEILNRWIEMTPENKNLAIQNQLSQKIQNGQLEILEGRAVYPRIYTAHTGDSGGNSSIKVNADYDRLVWMLLNGKVSVISLPVVKEDFDQPIPDPQDLIVIGEKKEDYLSAQWVTAVISGKVQTWEAASIDKKDSDE
ncbi:MAG TPA: hypothetical protein PKX80_05115 [Flexilinea sp.]|nr:hypothetical protein [Flexilinea sp.]